MAAEETWASHEAVAFDEVELPLGIQGFTATCSWRGEPMSGCGSQTDRTKYIRDPCQAR